MNKTLLLVSVSFVVIGCAQRKIIEKLPEQVVPSSPVQTKDIVDTMPSSDVIQGRMQTVHFDFNKYVIRTNDVTSLEGDAKVLSAYSNVTVLIEGNCDDRGTAEYNMALGTKRANASKDYLVKLGINADRLSTISYGKEKPVAPAHTEEARAQNRRVDFKVKLESNPVFIPSEQESVKTVLKESTVVAEKKLEVVQKTKIQSSPKNRIGIRTFIPGMAQLGNGEKIKGWSIIGGEAIFLIGGIVGWHLNITEYDKYKKLPFGTSQDEFDKCIHNSEFYGDVSIGSFTGFGVLYLYSVMDAIWFSHAKETISDKKQGFYLIPEKDGISLVSMIKF